ncbi:hypothetical protein F2Q70_00017523 [Brassica cretica]|uniref:Uncharacterized protein n=2 Tax=Brassica cretica TaxID=69181 RepID=A0A3N6PXU2_BRACR|nr:hypothetical protein F2Q70_00017523 [Brassica cretica]KAF2583303.1 hypothetical protein F2Q68_00004508 [Brassica cretica]KAF3567479.1 hypothetical protein DY000_02016269 [Brassica cretica]
MWPREHGALVGPVLPRPHGLMGTWPWEHEALMVDLLICCSEHDVSSCFSEHGGTLLMSWKSWPEPGFVGYKHVDEDGLLGVKPCLGDCGLVDKEGDPALRILPYGYGPVYVVGALVAAGEIAR